MNSAETVKARRKTKIICTLGPSSDTEEIVTEMIKAGMNVARINCSHSLRIDSEAKVKLVQKVREELNAPIPVMIDTKGPEIRIGSFETNTVVLRDNGNFTLNCHDSEGSQNNVSVDYKKLYKDVEPGDTILIDDGLIRLTVSNIDEKNKDINCRIDAGGILSSHKSVNIPGKKINMKYLSPKDKEDLLMAAKNDVDFVACSFVSDASDLKTVRRFLDLNDGQNVSLLAKIENQQGIDNIDEICENCDGLMIARGDLGVEVNFNHLPTIQKYLIDKCREHNRPSIVCTEMLESMINKPRPTRAEISDVANAVYDGASAVMLSGETAMGAHPINSIRTMHNIAKVSENSETFKSRNFNTTKKIRNKNIDALAHSAYTMSKDIEAEGILCFTEGGYTPNVIAHFRPEADTIAVTDNKRTYYKMALFWGIHPFFQSFKEDVYEIIHNSKQFCQDWLKLKKGSELVLIIGWAEIQRGTSSTIQIIKL